jgi:sulfur-carrier protein
MVRVELPTHLRTLARVEGEIRLDVVGAPTVNSVLDALETRYPVLKGTIRDHRTAERRAFIRYFADGIDLSHLPPDAPLPDSVQSGAEVLRVIGAIAGG